MSNFITRLEEHPLHDYVQALTEKIDLIKKIEVLNDFEVNTLIRIETIYNIVYSRINSTDSTLISKNTLENLSKETDIINKKLDLFYRNFDNNSAERKQNIINEINDSLEEVVIYNTQIFQPLVPSEVESLKESIVTARQSLAQHNRYIKEEYQDFRNKKNEAENQITELESQIHSLKTEIENTVELSNEKLEDNEKVLMEKHKEYQKQFDDLKKSVNQEITELIDSSADALNSFDQKFSKVEAQKLEEFSEFQSEIKLQIDEMLSNNSERLREYEQRFSEKQEDRTEQFSELQNERKEKFDEELKNMQDLFANEIKKLQADFQEHITTINSEKDELKTNIQTTKDELYKLIEVAGNDVMSDGYAKYANNAANLKYMWQGISVLFLIGLVGAAYSIIPTLEQEIFDWSTLAARSLLTLSVATLAGFTIRQAHLSHVEEQRNREMQLKLGSIEPYLKNFDIEKRNEIKESLVLDYFSKERKVNDTISNQEVMSENRDE